MGKWIKKNVKTSRGNFEIFIKGEGEPVCVTHLYSSFNESGDYFADTFTESNKVILVNLREAGNSEKEHEPYQLSMLEALFDLEAIRETLGYKMWSFAGHSTGGMLGVLYGIYFSNSLHKLIIVGAAARDYTESENCIYNEKHESFAYMQQLLEGLKSKDISETERINLTENRTKLSLKKPKKFNDYFSKAINKKMCAERLNFFNRELVIFDVTKKLQHIICPTLIICGRFDVQCPVEYSIEMNKSIPKSSLVVLEYSNHYPFLEEEKHFKNSVESFLLNP
ncbi:proline iminopeptidase [Lottiidibacillus patelloidae]|uniref:Proline iminopeptidase n=1 Tax=Lottiidibacillus patelloidae TaxID=2670334 RepID=A0A263BXA0_9BACI|nr:alpha/beta hydrolase [Lottiidibacillus patelloidae]OZM58334.1 proline iminopeptidase [Lottiidibacillus patelloidae]